MRLPRCGGRPITAHYEEKAGPFRGPTCPFNQATHEPFRDGP